MPFKSWFTGAEIVEWHAGFFFGYLLLINELQRHQVPVCIQKIDRYLIDWIFFLHLSTGECWQKEIETSGKEKSANRKKLESTTTSFWTDDSVGWRQSHSKLALASWSHGNTFFIRHWSNRIWTDWHLTRGTQWCQCFCLLGPIVTVHKMLVILFLYSVRPSF